MFRVQEEYDEGISLTASEEATNNKIAEQYGLKAWWTKKREASNAKVIREIEAGLKTTQLKRTEHLRHAAANRYIPNTRKFDKNIKLFDEILSGFKQAGKTSSKGLVEVTQRNELNGLAEIYASDPLRAQLEAARAGVPLCEVAFHYGKGTALTGLQLGLKHGQEESTGARGAPGALKLWLLQKLHGSGYVLGRQQGLGGKHGGTRSGASIIDALPALLKGISRGQT